MLNRKIEHKIKEWLIGNKASLLIDGARQVGKTTTIRKVLKEENIDFVELNLLENKDLAEMLENIENVSTSELIAQLKLYTNHELKKNKTIIFIDEVQQCCELITKVKFLVDEGSFRYIFSGSLLGLELANVKSIPVGYMYQLKMYPLDFEEFLLNTGVDKDTIKILETSFENLKPVNPFIHKQIMKRFDQYLVVGGMPKAVQTFVDTHDYNQVYDIHQFIIDAYKADFTKYEKNSKKLLLKAAFDNIPAELNSQNKRYIVKNLNDAHHHKRLEETFEWHNAAGVSIPVYNCTEPVSPLLLNKKLNLFKLFLNDVGLLTTMFGKSVIKKILNGKTDINFGAVYENYVAQEFNSHFLNCYYFNSKKFGEIDFIIEYDGVLPIEVKSGATYTKHRALDSIMSNKAYNIKKAYVLSNENLSYADISTVKKAGRDFEFKDEYRVIYLPIYMTIFIDESTIDLTS